MGGGVTHFLCGKCGKCGKRYPSAFCWIFQQRLLDFPTAFSRAKAVPLHRISKRAETTKTTKTTKNYARNYESPYLPAAQPKHKGRVQPPTALPNAYHAYLRQDSRRIRHLRRKSTQNHTLTVILPVMPARVRRRPRLLK